MSDNGMKDISMLLDGWSDNGNRAKAAFVELKSFLESEAGVGLQCIARPGISYSLRAKHDSQEKRPLFAMVDVIDDDPDNRWLSVCFYKELVDDPDELADEVPGGLLGEDARCFDVDEYDENLLTYLKQRLAVARDRATREV